MFGAVRLQELSISGIVGFKNGVSRQGGFWLVGFRSNAPVGNLHFPGADLQNPRAFSLSSIVIFPDTFAQFASLQKNGVLHFGFVVLQNWFLKTEHDLQNYGVLQNCSPKCSTHSELPSFHHIAVDSNDVPRLRASQMGRNLSCVWVRC